MREYAGNPLDSLIEKNWLPSCGGLFRTATVGEEFFDGVTRYLEWTVTAYRLALTRRIGFGEVDTFVINDSEGSLSKSLAYERGVVEAMRVILSLPLPPAARRALSRKLGAGLHALSNSALARGDVMEALRAHVRSLMQPGGMRYLTYSRHVLAALARVGNYS